MICIYKITITSISNISTADRCTVEVSKQELETSMT